MKYVIALLILGSATAQADYNLAKNGQNITCVSAANETFFLNASRNRITYTDAAGTSSGQRVITKVQDNTTTITYTAPSLGAITFTTTDSFKFTGSTAVIQLTCQ